jgi:hypothetical protein
VPWDLSTHRGKDIVYREPVAIDGTRRAGTTRVAMTTKAQGLD